MACTHSPTEYDRNKPGTVKQLLFSSADSFEKCGDFIFLWRELVEMNMLQFLVNWFWCGSALTGWGSSYHMCRNRFVQQTPPCSQARKHMYCTTVILLKGQAQNFTSHLLNLCSDHKINLQKDTYYLTRRGLSWKGIQPSPSHTSKRSFLPSLFTLLSSGFKKFTFYYVQSSLLVEKVGFAGGSLWYFVWGQYLWLLHRERRMRGKWKISHQVVCRAWYYESQPKGYQEPWLGNPWCQGNFRRFILGVKLPHSCLIAESVFWVLL